MNISKLALLAPVALAVSAQSGPTPVRVVRQGPPPALIHGADVCLPIKFADGLPVIPATIAGKAITLGFDTGAPGIVHLNQPLVDELKLTKIGQTRATDPSGRNVLTLGVYGIKDLKLGRFSIDQWVASGDAPSTRRFANPDGIIGLDAFRGYIVTIDYPGRRLIVTKGSLPAPDGKASFHYEGPIPRVPLTVDGHPIDAHIDSGNSRYAVIVPQTFAAQLPNYGNRFPIGSARTVNNKYDLVALPVHESRIGEFPLYAGTVAYPGPSETGNIGSQILRDMIVRVDPANSIISFERAKPGLEDGCPNA
jgi:hypothetical protein